MEDAAAVPLVTYDFREFKVGAQVTYVWGTRYVVAVVRPTHKMVDRRCTCALVFCHAYIWHFAVIRVAPVSLPKQPQQYNNPMVAFCLTLVSCRLRSSSFCQSDTRLEKSVTCTLEGFRTCTCSTTICGYKLYPPLVLQHDCIE